MISFYIYIYIIIIFVCGSATPVPKTYEFIRSRPGRLRQPASALCSNTRPPRTTSSPTAVSV